MHSSTSHATFKLFGLDFETWIEPDSNHRALSYIGVVVRLQGTDIQRGLWGIESNAHEYHKEVEAELAGEIAREASTEIAREIARLRAIQVKARKAARLYGAAVREAAKRA